MSATELLMERVKSMDEAQAKAVLGMLEKMPSGQPAPKTTANAKGGVWSVLGYAKK
ncbi:MAG: hypothetical protein ACRD3R_09440 [Terriglobales bacterium]